MRWYFEFDKNDYQECFSFIKEFASHYDLSNLKWIKIAEGKREIVGVHGICRYPNWGDRGYYRISCYIPGPLPFNVLSKAKGFIFQNEDGTWPPKPIGSKIEARGSYKIDGNSIKWKRIESFTELNDYDDAIIWIFGHEFFHFLSQSKQIDLRNTESNADGFADDLLKDFKKLRQIIK